MAPSSSSCSSVPHARRFGLGFGAVVALVFAAIPLTRPAQAAEPAVAIPAPALDNPKAAGPPQTAVLAGGCFWGLQGVFEHVKGVLHVVAGYSGGAKATAHYEMVGTGTTGHAESVKIVFDPAQVSYGELLHVYFSVTTNPTELNRQGPDVGSQYRSTIFYGNARQQKIARAYIAQLGRAHVFDRPIVTTVVPLKGFYRAEAYHQDFLVHHPRNPYIVYNDLPKIAHLQHLLPKLYQPNAVLVAAR